jgi:hypothetical protein
MTQVIYGYREIERAYKILKDLVERESSLHLMDMTIQTQDLDNIQYEILPALEEIVFFDPTP